MKKFWTITDADTKSTNSRSTRFACEHNAIEAATQRINSGSAKEVHIMECVKTVKHLQQPVVVEDVTEIPETDLAMPPEL